MNKIRVLIADDHALVRAGIRLLLEGHPDIEVVGEAGSGCDVIEQASRLQPDVVLMDIAMGDVSGMEATQQIKERVPRVRVLALTMHDREEYFFAMLQAGAQGYVLKESDPEELLRAIRAVYRGEAYLSPAVTKAVLSDYLSHFAGQNRSHYEELSVREKEILRLVAEGYTTREIGELLCLSEKTVEKHRAAIMHKLGLQSLSQLIKYAIRKGLIEVDS
ncbi:MAG: response regulator transcription factor [Anaerolineae bacterium]|nr:response regulator transcription factor [Anaerolineae bacterium]MDW8070132.1 response regulator transcription factor [Anaerolineae bacterium]